MQNKVDPDNRYEQVGIRDVERIALQLLAHWPEAIVARGRDIIELRDDEVGGIILFIMPEVVEFRISSIIWLDSHTPSVSSKLWKRVQWSKVRENQLPLLLQELRDVANNQLRTCSYCEQSFVSGQMLDEDCCHSCGSEYRGVIY